MAYKNLRDFLELLESRGELKRITQEIDPYLEITEISDRPNSGNTCFGSASNSVTSIMLLRMPPM